MRKVVVTGANGFVGSEVVRQLASQGVFVYAVVRDRSSNLAPIERLGGLEVIHCPLDKIRELPQQIHDTGIDVFYHFAWSGTAGALRKDYGLQLLNAKWAGDAVESAAELGCRKFIFASSIMEYEVEKAMQAGMAPGEGHIYSVAKTVATRLGMILAGSRNMDYMPAIISNIYGPGEVSERLINTTIRKLLRHEETSFSTCENLYDFIYITDAGKAFVELGKKGRKNRKYYIGSGKPQRLRSYIEILRDTVDMTQELGFGKLKATGAVLQYDEFDMHSIYEDTGFVPEVSFESGIRKTVDWIKDSERIK